MTPRGLLRRAWLAAIASTASGAGWAQSAPSGSTGSSARVVTPVVKRGHVLRFPRDFGAHPEFRTEWWYVTGSLVLPGSDEPYGFQVTFFRSRVDADVATPSRFATRQLLFAHAAVTDPKRGRLLHDERIAREGFGVAQASLQDTQLKLRDWTLVRNDGTTPSYTASVASGGFALDLSFTETQALLLQGEAGYSQKGPDASQASYYYSKPQLAVRGQLWLDNQRHAVTGTAWLDHEWSEALLHPEAVGWDWVGMNLDDGSALTAFRLRRVDGSTLWTGGSWRTTASASGKSGVAQTDLKGRLAWTPLAWWNSPNTKARYPVAWRVESPVGTFTVRARLDAQELDSRTSTGTVYWEGLSDLFAADGQRIGRGYLEMTGYAAPLRL